MTRLQAYKFELRPDGVQRRLMRRFAGSCRYVYNRALVLQKERYERGERRLGYAKLCKEITIWRHEAVWLEAVHSQILQQALKDLERAYRNFFENTSRQCPTCGHTEAANRATQARFHCLECGYSENADLVAAINVLARGHRVAACGKTSPARGASAQEPTEANRHETVHAAP